MTNKELSPEEKQGIRDIALANLANPKLTDLAAAYFVEKKGSYGDDGKSAVHDFTYIPVLDNPTYIDFKTGEETNIIRDSLLGSRQEGERYTGTISEGRIIANSAQTFDIALASLKVDDIYELIGSEVKIKDKYKDKYLSDLIESEDEENKIFAQNLIGSYRKYFMNTKVSGALDKENEAIKGGLEKIATETEK